MRKSSFHLISAAEREIWGIFWTNKSCWTLVTMFWSKIGRESDYVFLPSGWSQQRRTCRDTSQATSSCQTARRCWRPAWTCTACHWRPFRRAAGRFSPPHTDRWTAPPAETPQTTKRSFFPAAALLSKRRLAVNSSWLLIASRAWSCYRDGSLTESHTDVGTNSCWAALFSRHSPSSGFYELMHLSSCRFGKSPQGTASTAGPVSSY